MMTNISHLYAMRKNLICFHKYQDSCRISMRYFKCLQKRKTMKS